MFPLIKGEADARDAKGPKGPAKFSALDTFKNMDSKGTTDSSDLETTVASTHQNSINNIAIVSGTVGNVKQFSTSGKDGKIVIWDMAEISAIPGLKA